MTSHGGISAEALTPAALAAAHRRTATQAALADHHVSMDGYTTEEVAKRLDVSPMNLRRDITAGHLCGIGGGSSDQSIFPRWQFTTDGVLPGLPVILAALPDGVHPLDLDTIMTTARESLGDTTPIDWLTNNGDPSRVAAIVEAIGLA